MRYTAPPPPSQPHPQEVAESNVRSAAAVQSSSGGVTIAAGEPAGADASSRAPSSAALSTGVEADPYAATAKAVDVAAAAAAADETRNADA